jgi:CHAD domain-containing protein
MEVEAKFVVPSRRTFLRLAALRSLAGYTLANSRSVQVHDQYFDTPDGRLYAAGYFCRLRREPDKVIATLKGLGDATGAVHQREEQEVELPEWLPDPDAWPAGSPRDLAVRLTGDHPLQPLFELNQSRSRWDVMDDERHVAEWSLDTVTVPLGERPAHYYELEVELKDAGTEDDLRPLAAELSERWHLPPQTHSKFQRAREMYLAYRQACEARLSPAERSAITTHAASGIAALARRATTVLAWADGLPSREIAARAGLSRQRALYWLRSFRARRLAIFRDELADATTPEMGSGSDSSAEAATSPVHAPPGDADQPAPPVSEPLHVKRKKGRKAAKRSARAAAKASEVESPPAQASVPAPSGAQGDVAIAADEAAEAATVSQPAGERNVSGAPDEGAGQPAGKKPEPPKVAPDEPMSEAGRKILYTHFCRMLENEEGTRQGDDSEALHDMRVATRRMRAAFQLFEPYFAPKALDPFGKSLKLTGRALGAVRDLDVLIAKAEAFGQKEAGTAGSQPLAPLLSAWRARREAAREELLAYLDEKKYARFKERFEKFLATPGAGALPEPPGQPTPYRVRHVVAGLLFNRYEAVRAYESSLPAAPLTTYHALRIECKRFRYALEFFRDILGTEAGGVIKQVTGMQDLLGDLHDAVVSEGMVAEFLHDQAASRINDAQPEVLDGVAHYLTAQWTIQRDLLARFPARWAELIGPDFRRNLSLAVAVL